MIHTIILAIKRYLAYVNEANKMTDRRLKIDGDAFGPRYLGPTFTCPECKRKVPNSEETYCDRCVEEAEKHGK